MFGDMAKMAKQVMEMKSKMAAVEKELRDLVLKGASRDGSVSFEITGKMQPKNIMINDAAMTDRKKLEKSVMEAVESAIKQATDVAQKKLTDVTGGVKIPGLNA